MPIYEYECESCGHQMEALQKVSDAALVDCPSCGKPGLRKKISAVGFRLKGGGWYETDFKTGNKKNIAGDGASKGSSTDAGGSASGSGAASSGSSAPAGDNAG